MIRFGLGRAVRAVTMLGLCVFVLGVRTASASHYRYGDISWVKVFDASVPADSYKVRVTFHGAWRWSFPWGSASTCPPSLGNATSACPPVGAVVNAGSIVASNPSTNQNVRFTSGSTTTTASTLNYLTTVNTVDPVLDQMFTEFTFDVTFLKTQNPVSLNFTNAARISTLLDNNHDTTWRLAAKIDASENAGTRSPQAVSLPVLYVTTGVANDVFIPTVAFDGFVNKLRFATTTESGLNAAIPLAPSVMTLDANTPGLVHFNPSAVGPYGVQFIIESYDTSVTPAVFKNSVPLEVIFQSRLAVVGATASLTTPLSSVFFPIGTQSSFQLTAKLSTAPIAGYTAVINKTPFPQVPATGAPGAPTFTQTGGTGLVDTVGTVTWTPTLQSSSTVMCFQAVYTKTSDGTQIVSPGMECVNMLLGAVATTTTMATPVGGAIGGPLTLSATVVRSLDGAPVVQRQVTFTTTPSTGVASYTAVTNSLGVATVQLFPFTAGPYSITATFNAVPNEFLQSSASTTATMSHGTATIGAPTLVGGAAVGVPVTLQSPLLLVGGQSTGAGRVVNFQITPGLDGSASTTMSGVTVYAGGMATATSAAVASAPGTFTAVATFPGDSDLTGPITSFSTTFNVVQDTKLTFPTTVSAAPAVAVALPLSLLRYPQGTSLGVQSVTVTFTGGPPTQVVSTNAAGNATVNVTWPSAGNFTATATYVPVAPNGNHLGVAGAETAVANVVVSTTATALSNVTVPTDTLTGNTLTASATLNKISAPAGPQANQTISFVLKTAAGATVTTVNGVTDAAGLATATFPALAARGAFTVTASFAGVTGLSAATSNVAPVTVYQRSKLTLGAITATAGTTQNVSATLTTFPLPGAPLSGQTVTFSFGGVIPNQSATADADGIATTPVTFPAAGVVPVSASFSSNDFFTNSAGAIPPAAETATVNATVSAIATALSAVTAPSTSLVGNTLNMTTTLTRTVAPVGALSGQIVLFTVTTPSGPVTLPATTNASGVASASLALTQNGGFTVSAAFAGGGVYAASSTATASVSVYQRTQLAMGAITATAGTSTTLSATLTTFPAGTAVSGQTITFSFGGAISSQSATTDAAGVATVNLTFPNPGTFTTTASFLNAAGFYANAAGAIPPTATAAASTATIGAAATALSALSVQSTTVVGNALAVSTVLTRTSAPAGPLSGQTVTFTMTGAASATLAATTTATGLASVTFPALTAKGNYTITATYAGTAALAASTSNAAAVTAYQPTQLSMAPITGTAGVPTTLSATLTTFPLPGTAVSGQFVTFTFGGGIPQQTVATNAAGVATVNVRFPDAGTFTTNASFINPAGLYADDTGAFPIIAETASATATINAVVTALAPLNVPSTTLVGDTPTVSTILTRTTAPAGALSGQTVTFTLSGASSATLTATTDATGLASVTLPALSVQGNDTVTASFAGTGSLTAATSNAGSVAVYQRTQLTLASATGTAGASMTLSATLKTLPGTAVSGQTVTFDFGGAIPAQTASTDASGVATISATFPNAGTFTTTASFLNAGAFYADHTGAFPVVAETASSSATINAAATALSPVIAPATALTGGTIIATSTLTRTSAPTGTVAGASVTFTLTGPSTQTVVATTDSNGVATATFAPLTARGAHTITAQYAGSGAQAASATAPVDVTVYQKTQLTLAPVSGTAGAAQTVSATLTAQPASLPVSGQTIAFDFGGVLPNQTAVTDATGVATVTVTYALGGTFTVNGSFINAAGFYADHTGAFPVIAETATATAAIAKAATALAPPAAPATSLVGDAITVSTTLNRTSQPVGAAAGELVTLTLTGASTTSATATTSVTGLASTTFPTLTARGTYTVIASFAEGPSLAASTSAPTTVTVYQRTQLALNPASGDAGAPVTITAALHQSPGGGPVANQTVNFDFGGVIAPRTATTDAAGIATVTVTFPNAGTFTTTASFLNAADFFADHNGALAAEVATSTATVTAAATVLAPLTVPATALTGNSLTVATTLTRTAAPAGAVPGAIVTFTLSGASSQALTATTDASGQVSVSFPLTNRGAVTVTATYAGSTALLPATKSADLVVYQRAQLALGAVTATAGTPVAFNATLQAQPGATAIAGETVTFSFGASAPPQTATTNAAGVASVSVTFANAGTVNATASFLDAAGFYADHTGALVPETASTTATVADPTPPVITPHVSGTIGSNGWYTSDVAVSWTVVDNESTVASQTGCDPTTIANDGAAIVVSCSAISAGGTASQSVTIKRDATAPVVTVPAAQTSDATNAAGAIVNYPAASALDATSGVASVACVPAAGSLFPLGASTVTCTATDNAGETSTAPFTVTVADATPPVITAADVAAEATGPQTAVSFAPTAADSVDGSVAVSCTPVSGSTFAVGATTVSCTAQDARHNVATKAFTVTVTDHTAPTIAAHAPVSISATGPEGAAVTYLSPATHDLVDPDATAICSPLSGTTFTLGAHTVTCSAIDAHGNHAVDTTFTVTVTNNAPTFTPPGNISVSAVNASGAVVTYSAAGNDVEQGSIGAVCTPASGSTFPIATTTVNCTVTDIAGATATGSFTVTVTNNVPTFTAPAPIVLEATGPGGAVATYAPTGSDVESGTLAAACTPASGATFAIGVNTVNCTVTDGASATASASFMVTVLDRTAPVLHLPSDIVAHAATSAGSVVTFVATATDAVDATDAVSCTPASGSTFGIAITTVNCSSTDAHGNISTGAFRVTVANRVPVATNNAYSGQWNTTLTVAANGVLAGDTDPDGDALTAALVTGPAHGTLSLNPNGGFTFAPAANYYGADSFTYKANDGRGGLSNVATIALTITSPCTPERWSSDFDCTRGIATVDNDTYTTKQQTTLTVSAGSGVLDNDDHYAASAALVTAPSHGTLTLAANGSFVYVPAAGFYGIDTFVYTARNSAGAAGPVATVTIKVKQNLAPDADNDYYTAKKNTTLTISSGDGVLDGDSDPNGDAITAVLVSGPAHGTLTLSANGSFVYKPAANYTGTDTFVYQAKDPLGLTDNATVTIRVGISGGHDDGHESHHHGNDGCDHEQHRNGHFDGDDCEHDRQGW